MLLVAVPPGVVTVIVPVAPLPTVALMVVALVTVKAVAAMPPKATAVAPVKLVPVMVTTVPVPPVLGVNEEMVGNGGEVQVKVPILVAMPPGVVTVIVPVAPLPSVAVIEVVLLTVKDLAAVPPKATAVAPKKLLPVMVTTVPGVPLLGVNDVMIGAEKKVKTPLLVAVPPGVVIMIAPVAPLPTVAVTEVALATVTAVAAVPPKDTAVAPVRLAPVMVTTVPVLPLLGVNEVMVGARVKVKALLLVAVPTGVVTLIVPVVPLPTVAVIVVRLTTVNEVTAVPPKATAVAPVKLVPVMVTTVPVPPMLGVNEAMVGA